MNKNLIIIALVVLCLLGTIWGSVKDKKSTSLERQLAAMRQNAAPAAAVVDGAAADKAHVAVKAAQAEVEDLKSQNKGLLSDAAALKGSLAGLREELASLKKEMAEDDGTSKALEAMQAQLNEGSAESAKLKKMVAAAKAELDKKNTALAAAEEAAAGLEDVKSTLANTVDAYSVKSQELLAEVERSAQRIRDLENALGERTKILMLNGEELGRTKLNMNVLLSKVAAQNKSLAILEETRLALEKELAVRLRIIEELQHRLSARVVVETVVTEDAAPVEMAPAH